MTQALTLNIADRLPSTDGVLKGVENIASEAKAIFCQMHSGVDEAFQTVVGHVKTSQEEAKALYGRASTSVNELLSQIGAEIEKIENDAGLSQKLNQASEKTKEIFDALHHKVEAVETQVELLATGCEMGTLVHRVEKVSHSAAKGVTAVTQPMQLITLIAEVKKVARSLFERIQNGTETVKEREMAILGFSIVSKVCSLLSWIQQLGLFSHQAASHAAGHAAAHVSRLSLIGSLSFLCMATLALAQEIGEHASTPKMATALLNFTVAALGLLLLYYVSKKVQALMLILTMATLLLSLYTKESHHVESDPAKAHAV